MDNLKIFYSVLRYIPSTVREEQINIGIAIHIPSLQFSKLYITSNRRRIKQFDDEYNPDFFKMVLSSLKYDLDFGSIDGDTTLPIGDFKDIKSEFFLESRTSYLANMFIFSPVNTITTDKNSIEEDIGNIKDTYLYYDKPKDKRITNSVMQQLLSKQINSYNLKNVIKKPSISDLFGKDIFDFKVNNILLKALSFEGKKDKTMTNNLKAILFDLNELKCSPDFSKVCLVRNEIPLANIDAENTETEDVITYKTFEDFNSKLLTINSKKDYEISMIPLSDVRIMLDKNGLS